jgi:hypothetical protein
MITPKEPRRALSRLAAMAGRTRISLLVCLFAFGLAGCGSDDGTIPSEQAGDMLALLDTLQNDVQDGDCDHVTGTAEEFSSRVENLPSGVDSDVRNELNKAAAHLDQLASDPDACTPVETGATEPSGVETTPDTTTTEETTPTTTDETTTTTTTTDEEAPTEPDNHGPGNGQQPDQAPAPPPTDQGPGGDTGGDGGGVSPPSGGVGPGGSAG